MIEFVPDAPWWASYAFGVVLALIAAVPTVMATRAKREARRAAVVTEEAHAETQAQLGRVLHNVENSHRIGLRDDLDQKVGGIIDVLEALRSEVGGLHSDHRDTQKQIAHINKNIEGIRTEARRDRRRIGTVERNFTKALDSAQNLLDMHHPGGVDLWDDVEEDPDDQL
jgi:predicted  nucleic acid-binding Zn-ribbon protein